MKITRTDYNEYVVGYVLTMSDGRIISVQYEKAFSNHPCPDYVAKIGCAGDETHRNFNEEEIDIILAHIKNDSDIKKFGEMITSIAYSDKSDMLTCPLYYSDVEEAFESI